MLGAALTAYAEYIGDVLVNRCTDIPEVPDEVAATGFRVIRYHGHAPPEDLECSGGYLAVWWEGPAMVPAPNGPCAGPMPVTLAAKYVRCWRIADADEQGITLYDDTWDADAAILADTAECVARALLALTCLDSPDDATDDLDTALLTVLRKPRFLGATPTGASGGAAGVVWRLTGVLGTLPSTS